MATLEDSVSLEWTGAIELQNCKMTRHNFTAINDSDTHDFETPIIEAFWDGGQLPPDECALEWAGSVIGFNQSSGSPIRGTVLLFTRDYT